MGRRGLCGEMEEEERLCGEMEEEGGCVVRWRKREVVW